MQEAKYMFDWKSKKIHLLLIELPNGIGIFTLNRGNYRHINVILGILINSIS